MAHFGSKKERKITCFHVNFLIQNIFYNKNSFGITNFVFLITFFLFTLSDIQINATKITSWKATKIQFQFRNSVSRNCRFSILGEVIPIWMIFGCAR